MVMMVKFIIPLFAVLVIVIALFRLISGDDTWPYTFPKAEGKYKFVASVTSKVGVCTGVILSADWVLTAAHCVYLEKDQIGDKDAKICTGLLNYQLPNSTTVHETMSSGIKIHPGYWRNKIAKWDLALIRLSEPMTFPSKFYSPIIIAEDPWPQDNQALNCMALGFGGIPTTAPLTRDLKVWNVTALHGEEACGSCAKRYQYKRLICLNEATPSVCRGDDGGPLVCGNYLYGIAHMIWDNETCAATEPLDKCYGGPKRGFSVFTYLCPAHDWLNTVIPNITNTQLSCKSTCVSSNLSILSVYLFVLFLLQC